MHHVLILLGVYTLELCVQVENIEAVHSYSC